MTVYVDIFYVSQKYKAPLDTGCDISMVLLPGLSCQEENQRMLVAIPFSNANPRNGNIVFFSWRNGDAS